MFATIFRLVAFSLNPSLWFALKDTLDEQQRKADEGRPVHFDHRTSLASVLDTKTLESRGNLWSV